MRILITIINTTVDLLAIIVFIYSLLSFFFDRYHPVRRILSAIVEPMLTPIRKLIPSVGGFDFSPLILIIILQLIGMILVAILRSFS